MSGYLAGESSDFCVGVVGAAAALSGLLVVTVSINIERIMEYPTLPTRAGQTLIVFVVPLVLGVLVLIPNQQRRSRSRADSGRRAHGRHPATDQPTVEPL